MLHGQVESMVCNADHCKLRAATGASQLKSVPGSELKMMKAGPYGVVSSPSQPFRGRVGPRSVLSFRRNTARRPASLSYCQALLFLKLFKLRLGKYFKPLKPGQLKVSYVSSAPDSVRNISDMMWVKSSLDNVRHIICT